MEELCFTFRESKYKKNKNNRRRTTEILKIATASSTATAGTKLHVPPEQQR